MPNAVPAVSFDEGGGDFFDFDSLKIYGIGLRANSRIALRTPATRIGMIVASRIPSKPANIEFGPEGFRV